MTALNEGPDTPTSQREDASKEGVEAVERAYGCLWRETGDAGLFVFRARKLLLSILDKEAQKRGITWALEQFGEPQPEQALDVIGPAPKEGGRAEEARREALEVVEYIAMGHLADFTFDGSRDGDQVDMARREAAIRIEGALLSFARGEVEWQPIETAPRDGTRIYAWTSAWPIARPISWFEGYRERGWWVFDSCTEAVGVTHWQPLPAPPSHRRNDQ